MKTLADWMREGDPVARDPGLSEDECAAVRRRIVQETARPRDRRLSWREPLTLAGGLALVMLAAMVTDHRAPAKPQTADGTARPAEPAARRQLQFATPGGTRIIWTFDPDFSLKEPAR